MNRQSRKGVDNGRIKVLIQSIAVYRNPIQIHPSIAEKRRAALHTDRQPDEAPRRLRPVEGGRRSPPIRTLAEDLLIIQNSVARVYRELEQAGILIINKVMALMFQIVEHRWHRLNVLNY